MRLGHLRLIGVWIGAPDPFKRLARFDGRMSGSG